MSPHSIKTRRTLRLARGLPRCEACTTSGPRSRPSRTISKTSGWAIRIGPLVDVPRHSVVAELKRSHARIYIAQGTADEADAIPVFAVMHAELLAQGRAVTADASKAATTASAPPDHPDSPTR